ncbi:MAG: hypothetical protein ABI193_03080 [Minicystis sp.]
MSPTTDIRCDPLSDYAAHFHAALGPGHRVASPLGAYMLLALIAPFATGNDRTELERALGCGAAEAAEFAASLLEIPHPAIHQAVAMWSREAFLGDDLRRWRDALSLAVERGAIPAQAVADEWARQATNDQIDRFPVTLDPNCVLLLASALAVSGKWQQPLWSEPAWRLGKCPWAQEIKEVFQIHPPGDRAIVSTRSAGLVGAAILETEEEFQVISVIGEAGLPHDRVIAAAHEVARLVSGLESPAEFCSLFDLPLAVGPAWEIEEQEIPSIHPDQRFENAIAYLPAWSVDGAVIDLLKNAAYGFSAAANALIAGLIPIPEGYSAEAAQRTIAKFDRFGFSAASVTAIAIMAGAAGPGRTELNHTARSRTATVRFSRPFAVVAVAGSSKKPHPWRGVPVFSAWVTRPGNPEPDRMFD